METAKSFLGGIGANSCKVSRGGEHRADNFVIETRVALYLGEVSLVRRVAFDRDDLPIDFNVTIGTIFGVVSRRSCPANRYAHASNTFVNTLTFC